MSTAKSALLSNHIRPPEFVGATEGWDEVSSSFMSIPLTVPVDARAGDHMIALFFIQATLVDETSMLGPDGSQAIAFVLRGNVMARLFKKEVTADDPGSTVTVRTSGQVSSAEAIGQLLIYRGSDISELTVGVDSFYNDGANPDAVAPSLECPPGSMVARGFSFNSGADPGDAPFPLTQRSKVASVSGLLKASVIGDEVSENTTTGTRSMTAINATLTFTLVVPKL